MKTQRRLLVPPLHEIRYVHGHGLYIGAMNDDYQACGYGEMFYTNRDVYKGWWLNGMPHGHGKMSYAFGDVYEGDWKEGMRHGYGKMSYYMNGVYIGKWNEEKRHGQGKYTFLNDEAYEGRWRNNEFDGVMAHTESEGRTILKEFSNGVCVRVLPPVLFKPT